LSMAGLGWLDESELDTVPTARPVPIDTATGEILDEPPHTNGRNGHGRPARREPDRYDDGLLRNAARFASDCAHCGERIQAGDQQVYDRGARRAYHPDCYDEAVGRAIAEEAGTDDGDPFDAAPFDADARG